MRDFLKENWQYILIGFGIIILYFLRLYNLTILPVFADEAIYIRWSQVMKAEETLRFLPLSDGKQPLFMWVVIPFLKFIQDPLFAGRLVSVLSGFGTLIGIFVATLLLFKSKKVALISTTIYALSPYAVFFDRLALSDSMLSMFGIWTFIFAYLTVTTERLDFAMLAGFALGGAWLTKSPALFFALLIPTLWLFAKSYKSLPRQLSLSLVTVVIGYGMYNILRLGPNFHQIAIRNLDYVYPYLHILTSPLDPLKPYADRILEYYRMMGPWPVVVMLLLSYFVNGRENWKKIVVLSAWFLGPIFAVSEFSKTMTARYAFFTVPFVIILATSLFLTKSKLLSKIGTILFIFFVSK
jgi:4-amino-4-deoxy-L-arabinose transferase-like glycosyltransferase